MKMMFRNLILGILVISSFSGCMKNQKADVASCNYDPCSLKAPASEIAAVQNYLTANNITATQHCSGLFYVIDQPGTGSSAQVCSVITVTYEGKLTNGTVFDSANSPVTFNLSQTIPGWKNGIPLIKSGGRIYLYVPPSLAYGNQAAGSIPPNSILIFRVEL